MQEALFFVGKNRDIDYDSLNYENPRSRNVLAISFFTLIFSSLLWLIVSIRFVADNLNGISFLEAGTVNLLMYVLLVCLPLLIMWMVFGFINQYLNNRTTLFQMQKLFAQMKRNQDYSDLLSRILIETEQQVKDGFVLWKFDLLIADMNELLAEIIHGSKLASGEQIERLWNKVQNGGKWSFGKVIIEINNSQPNFQMRMYEKSVRDSVLAGTIMEFCARYQSVVSLLEKHDKEKTFLNMIETGVMGKVFSIFAPVADELQKIRNAGVGFVSAKPAPSAYQPQPEPRTVPQQPRPAPMPAGALNDDEGVEDSRPSLLGKLKVFGKKSENKPRIEPEIEEKDPFSEALERSFGAADEETPRLRMSESTPEDEKLLPTIGLPVNETVFFEASETERKDETPLKEDELQKKDDAEEETLTDTQKTLNSLRKEWNDFKTDSRSEEEENIAYPFGGWTNEQNYK